MSQRFSRAETRRAKPASGVTRAAVRSLASNVSRIIRAMALASADSSAASTSDRPSSASLAKLGTSVPAVAESWSRVSRQSAVASAGASASMIMRRRASRLGPISMPGHSATAPGSISSATNVLSNVFCGCPTSERIPARCSSEAAESSPGKTISPIGNCSAAFINTRPAGVAPVEPAMMTGASGGCASQASAVASAASNLL